MKSLIQPLVLAGILLAVASESALAQRSPTPTEPCARVSDSGIEIRLPNVGDAESLHIQYRGESGTWRNLRNEPVTDEKYIGNLVKDSSVNVRVRAQTDNGFTEWSDEITCSPTPERREADTWTDYLHAINQDPFEVFAWPGTHAQLQELLPRASIESRGRHLVVKEHGGMMRALPRVVFAGMRLGTVPRFGIDGHGDPGTLSTTELAMWRQFFDLVAKWERIPPRPPNPPEPYPDWVMPGLVLEGSINPAPDGGGYPEDGDPVGPNDKMCKMLVCEPAVCGPMPFPPDGEFTDCSDLKDDLDDLLDVVDYWGEQVDFWRDARNLIDLTIKGKATAESGVAVAKMASALGLILSPEPISTVVGVIMAAQTFAGFAAGQLFDALGICPSGTDCALGTALAEAESNLANAQSRLASYMNLAAELRETLRACMQAAAENNTKLQAELDAFNEAYDAWKNCVDNQVCEWISQPCS